MFESVNELAVLVSAILAVAVGSIWYSPLLFGSIWIRSKDQASHEIETSKKHMIVSTVKAVLVQIIFFMALSQINTIRTEDISMVFIMATIIWIILSTQTASLVIWEKKPMSYLLVHIGYMAIILFGGLSIIIFWPW